MKRVRDETGDVRDRYVYLRCNQNLDPLQDTKAQKWAASTLKPPTDT